MASAYKKLFNRQQNPNLLDSAGGNIAPHGRGPKRYRSQLLWSWVIFTPLCTDLPTPPPLSRLPKVPIAVVGFFTNDDKA
jgi:hypothetical protein